MFKLSTKILVVDDMLTMRKLIKISLTEMGFNQFEEAEDGAKAWAKLNDVAEIGIIISDWNMPNCSGLQFLEMVRAHEKFKHLPFILLTAQGEAAQVKEAFKAGVDNYVIKPFTLQALKEKLDLTYQKKIA